MTIRELNLTRQVHTLKSALRESQDASDTMELEKAALEEAFKRTIKVRRNTKWMEEKLTFKFIYLPIFLIVPRVGGTVTSCLLCELTSNL